jgi:fructose-1-phosphate kinase PfkB-like protein
MVKPNREELEPVIGFALEAEQSQWRALDLLAERGVAVTVLSLGAEGLRSRWDRRRYTAVPPLVREVNALGCGDSLVAGIALARLRGDPPAECLRHGVACAAANAGVWDPGGIETETVAKLMPRVNVREVAVQAMKR